jgi:hypothetical protein
MLGVNFNSVRYRRNYVTYIDVLLPTYCTISLAFAVTCFGLESMSSSESYEPLRRTQLIWQLVYVAGFIHRCQFVVKLQS